MRIGFHPITGKMVIHFWVRCGTCNIRFYLESHDLKFLAYKNGERVYEWECLFCYPNGRSKENSDVKN